VRNLGDNGHATVALRGAIAKGLAVGPRIFTAGKSIATTGGHADPTNGWAERIRFDPGPADGVINGPIEAAKAVRQRYKDGADLIKITATGGVLSLAKSPDNPQFTEDEIRAIVTTAHDYGMTVAAHAHGAEGMKRAIRAGVDSIEHGTRLDDEVLRAARVGRELALAPTQVGLRLLERERILGGVSEYGVHIRGAERYRKASMRSSAPVIASKPVAITSVSSSWNSPFAIRMPLLVMLSIGLPCRLTNFTLARLYVS